jgi:hypothetical protein
MNGLRSLQEKCSAAFPTLTWMMWMAAASQSAEDMLPLPLAQRKAWCWPSGLLTEAVMGRGPQIG